MQFATLIAVIAICRVPTGVLSDEIATDPTDGDDIRQLDRGESTLLMNLMDFLEVQILLWKLP